MKKTLFAILTVLIATTLSAQRPRDDGRQKNGKEKIEEIVTDLSSQQKTRIDAITKRSSKNIEHYRSELQAVRDSIRIYMSKREDHSDKVFALYDREAILQAELSKEYYRSKVAIDAVLTPEQFNRLQEQMSSKRARHASQSAPAKNRHKGKSK